MKAASVTKQMGTARRRLNTVRKRVGGMGKTIVATVTGAALVLGNLGKTIRDGASGLKDQAFHNKKKSGEVIQVKKSTIVALLVALAAVAGVLGALYFYVLRREKELDEYEQLLFSEDFNDDLLDDTDDIDDDKA